jgi:hypothetical protein
MKALCWHSKGDISGFMRPTRGSGTAEKDASNANIVIRKAARAISRCSLHST